MSHKVFLNYPLGKLSRTPVGGGTFLRHLAPSLMSSPQIHQMASSIADNASLSVPPRNIFSHQILQIISSSKCFFCKWFKSSSYSSTARGASSKIYTSYFLHKVLLISSSKFSSFLHCDKTASTKLQFVLSLKSKFIYPFHFLKM